MAYTLDDRERFLWTIMSALKDQAYATAFRAGLPPSMMRSKVVNDGREMWEQYLEPRARDLYEWCAGQLGETERVRRA